MKAQPFSKRSSFFLKDSTDVKAQGRDEGFWIEFKAQKNVNQRNIWHISRIKIILQQRNRAKALLLEVAHEKL